MKVSFTQNSMKKMMGIRIGTPAVTTRGLVEADMEKLAELIDLAIRDFDNKKDYIRSEVVKLTEKYPIYR